MRDLIAGLVAYLLALALLATAFGFLVATLYFALAEVLAPPLAALLTSLALAVAAGLVVLSVRYRKPWQPAGGVSADRLLLSISEQVRRDPWLSLAAAAVLGILAEVSHSSSKPPPA